MAKKDDKKIKGIDQPESAGSKLVTALIALIIIIIWLVVFAFLIKLDVGGIGSNVLYPVLKDVPLVNKILPSVSEEQQAEEGNYKYTTLCCIFIVSFSKSISSQINPHTSPVLIPV